MTPSRVKVPKRILLPVDFSDCSKPAVEAARDLARRFDAEVGIVHVWSPPPFSPPETLVIAPGEGRETLGEHIRRTTTAELSNVLPEANNPGLRIAERTVHFGDPARVIVAHAERHHYDLIVMGTHGRTGFSHLALGSVAERVLRQARCPVLVVPAPEARR